MSVPSLIKQQQSEPLMLEDFFLKFKQLGFVYDRYNKSEKTIPQLFDFKVSLKTSRIGPPSDSSTDSVLTESTLPDISSDSFAETLDHLLDQVIFYFLLYIKTLTSKSDLYSRTLVVSLERPKHSLNPTVRFWNCVGNMKQVIKC